MSEILGDKLNIVYEDTLLEITPELMKKTIISQNKEIERLNNIIKEVREYIKQTGQYLEDIKRFKVDVLEPNYLDILEILDKEKNNV